MERPLVCLVSLSRNSNITPEDVLSISKRPYNNLAIHELLQSFGGRDTPTLLEISRILLADYAFEML